MREANKPDMQNVYIGVLFPMKRTNIGDGKKKSGALPARKAVYTLLRRSDRTKADEIPAPLRTCLGRTSLISGKQNRLDLS